MHLLKGNYVHFVMREHIVIAVNDMGGILKD